MGQNDNSGDTAGKNESGENSTVNLESGQVRKEINDDKSRVVDIEVAGIANQAGAVEVAIDCQTTVKQTEVAEVTLERQSADRTEVAEVTLDRQSADQTEAVEIVVDGQVAEPTEVVEVVVDGQTAEPSEVVEITIDHQTDGQTKPNCASKSGNNEQFDRKSTNDRSTEGSPNQSGGSCRSIGKVNGAEHQQENAKKTERNSSFSELTAIVVNDKSICTTKRKQGTDWEKFKCYFLLLLMFLLTIWVILYFSFLTGYPIPFVKKVLESWGFKV